MTIAEKRRRSRFIACLRAHGYTYRVIGQRLGLSVERVRQLAFHHQRWVVERALDNSGLYLGEVERWITTRVSK